MLAALSVRCHLSNFNVLVCMYYFSDSVLAPVSVKRAKLKKQTPLRFTLPTVRM